MKRISKKILSAIIMSSLILATVAGCGEKKDSSSLTDSEKEKLQKPGLQITYGQEVDPTDPLDKPDPTAPAGDTTPTSSAVEETTEIITVTDAKGEPVTEFVAVTEANGEVVTEQVVVTEAGGAVVTDTKGETVTTVVTATEVVNVTEVVTNAPSKETNVVTEEATSSNHVSAMKRFNAYWMDISEDKNYIFNDSFIEVDVKIKEDIPDGKYPINITWPDFACRDDVMIGKTVDVDHVLNGYLYVNTPVDEEQVMPNDGLSVMAESVECKQGEEVVLKFKIKNNPGMCAINFNFEYDENAIEVLGAYATGEFAEITNADNMG